MTVPSPLAEALAEVRAAVLDPDALVRAVAAGRRRGTTSAWRRVELRPVDLTAGRRLQVVRYDATQAFTDNHPYGPDAEAVVDSLLGEPFGNWHVDRVDQTLQLRVTKKGEAQLHRSAPQRTAGALAHDRVKPRMVDPAETYLHVLGLTTADGRVKPSRQDKLRQVEEFVRALDAAVTDAGPLLLDLGRPLRVVDLGCGNAYLTLAAYRHLTATRGLEVEMVGVDVRPQARERNAAIADELGWSEGIRFVEATIDDVDIDAPDVVLALHACDTATDDALARAVRWGATLVLAAPCCHHDVQRQIQESPVVPVSWVTTMRHGILRERFADVLTDSFRASLLRMAGYRVDVVEFVGSQHTPRNTLIRAVRTGSAPTPDVVTGYHDLAGSWGVSPRLATLLPDVVPGAAS